MSENQETRVNREGWLWLAPQYFNQWRVFPRAFIIFYFWLCMETAMWFMGLPAPGAAQAAFASAIVSAGAAWFGLYVNSGPSSRWNQSVATPTINVNPPPTPSPTYVDEQYNQGVDRRRYNPETGEFDGSSQPRG